MRIEILPAESVVIDGVAICLGMERAALEAAIGCAEPVRGRCYYYDGEMAIDYDTDDRVEYIEFLGGIDGQLRPVLYGVSVFETPAAEVAALLERENNGEIDDTEGQYCRSYLNIGIGVYRETTPADVLEMMEEMKADGICIENNEDVLEEQRKANYWATIGVGSVDYFHR